MAMNTSVDDDGGNIHTGGVGNLFPQASIGSAGIAGFAADRSAFSLMHEKEKVQAVMPIVQDAD